MIQIRNLVKKYNKNVVLSINDLTIESGDIVALVGNNGAGKTTLMNILSGIIKPTSGKCTIGGLPPYVNMQCSDNIVLIDEKMRYCGSCRLDKILVELKEAMGNFNYQNSLKLMNDFKIDVGKKYGHLSKGMKNIFNIIVGFCLPQKVILFDEITSGLDEFARLKFADLLSREIITNPKTYILSTHLFGEVSGITEKVLLIRSGRMEFFSSVDDLSCRLISLRGLSQDIENFAKDRSCFTDKTVGNYREVVITNNLTRHDKIYLADYGIEIVTLPVSQICAILTNCDEQLMGDVI